MKRLILSTCLVCLLNLWAWNIVVGEDGQPVVQSTKVEFYGTVRDEVGKGVANCQITFSAPWRERGERFLVSRYIKQDELATFVVTTDAQGDYRASIDVADPRWLGPGEGAIMAFSPSAGLAVEAYLLDRGLVDLPLDLVLAKRSTAPFVLQDETGSPIAGARITPVRYGKVALPSQLGERFAVTTDASGKADIIRTQFDLDAVLVQTAGELAGQLQTVSDTKSYLTVQPAVANGPQVATLIRPLQRLLRIQHLDPAQTANLPAIAWTIISLNQGNNRLDATWQEFRTAPGEATAAIHLPPGSLRIITDAESGHGLFSSYGQSSETLNAELNEVLAVLEPGQRVTGSVVSATDGSPLPGITLQNFGNSHVLSQADGSFAAWLPKLTGGFYPIDPLQRHFFQDSFYVSPNAESSPGQATVPTFQLIASDRTNGTVLSADGQPCVGVTVSCESKQERFTTSQQILTDRQGQFTIYGLQAGTPVKLTVADRRGVTESPVELSLDPKEIITIQLAPATPVRFLGQVVDDAGQPIANAQVSILRGVVSIDNGYQPIEYSSADAFGNDAAQPPTFIITDSEGRFQSTECFDSKHPFAVTLEHPNHFAKRTSYRTFSSQGSSHEYDFGQIVMRAMPTDGLVQCLVNNHEGMPVAGANVVLVQPGSSAGQQLTGEDGTVSFSAKNSAGVVGVLHPELGASFFVYEPPKQLSDEAAGSAIPDASPFVITLDPKNAAAPWPTRSADRQQRRALAKKLLERFEFVKQPDLDKVSAFEASILLGAMAFTSPAWTVTYAISNAAELTKRADIGMSFIIKVIEREPELVATLMPVMPDMIRSGVLTERAADATAPESQRRKDIEQSLTIARGMSGDEAAVALGRIAMLLLELDDIESATYIIEEFFEDYRDEAVSSSGQRSKRGVARYFYPQLALVDFELACKLIREQAYPNEIERLHALALVLAVISGQTDWDSGLEAVGTTVLKQSEDALVPGGFGRTPLPNSQFVEQLGSRLTNPHRRGLLFVGSAMRTPGLSAAERAEALKRGLTELAGDTQPPDSYYFNSLAYEWKQDWKALQSIDPGLARRAIFECFSELSNHRDGQYDHLAERTTLVAQALGPVAPEASRVLLSPFLKDLTWRMGARDIGPITPLGVAAEIDPEWAAQIAEQLMDEEFRTDRLRQILVLDSLLDGLAKP